MTSIAIIGFYSENFVSGMLSEIQQNKDQIELISISDQDEALLLKYQKSWDIKKLYTDPKDLIITESPDILIISLNSDNLTEIISFATSKKVKGIILNNPIATSPELSQKFLDLCRLSNTNLIVSYKRRWDPLYLEVKNIIDSKVYGKLTSISCDICNNSAKTNDYQDIINEFGGGDLLYNGSNMIDLIRYFSGEVASINSSLKRENSKYGTETSSYSILNMHSGVTSILKTNNISIYDNFELDLFFKKGRIKVGKNIKKFYKIVKNKDQNSMAELIESPPPELPPKKTFNSGAVIEMVNSINKKILPESSGLNAIKNIEIAFGIYYSAYLGGNTVNLPLKIAGNPLKKMFQSDMI